MNGYWKSIHQQYKRIQGKTKVIHSPYGDIEYNEGGTGPNVLISHGSGGGFDQGELIVQAVLNQQFHWITPSRFGYLQSTYQPGSTFDDQAHAYAALLDHLGIKKVAVIALSHGGPSANIQNDSGGSRCIRLRHFIAERICQELLKFAVYA